MKKALNDINLVQKYSRDMDGVFSTGDLCRLFGEETPVLLYRRIHTLEEAGIISRFMRGFYVTPGFNHEALSARVNTDSYISCGTILAKELMIGSIPASTVYAVKIGRNRQYKDKHLSLVYMGCSKNQFFGYRIENGIRYATPEKAWLDTLFFYQKGRTFSFNIYEDIDTTRFDKKLIYRWLKKYRNPRFVSFVKGFLCD